MSDADVPVHCLRVGTRIGTSALVVLLTPASHAHVAAQADAIYRQGIAALQQRDLASARAAFEKAVQLQPRSPEGHNSLGWVLLAQKQVDPAIAQFQAALDLRHGFFSGAHEFVQRLPL